MEDITMEHPEFIEFEEKKYRLSSGNYYRVENWGKSTCNLHRAIWESHNKCKVPEGYDIHHIDGNVFNNDISNLEAIHGSEHSRFHLFERIKNGTWDFKKSLELAREAAKSWHGSPEGIKWHSKHGKETWVDRKIYITCCLYCGKNIEASFPSRKKFCNANCQNRYRYYSGKDNVQRTCVICGKNFTANKYSKIKTCAKDCANISTSRTKRCI
jgi:hypothetical protein